MRTWVRRCVAGAGVAAMLLLHASCGGGAVRREPDSDPGLKFRIAQAYLRGGKLNEAAASMEEAISLEPSNASFVNFYGQICLLAGRYPEAEAAFEKALKIDPRLTDAHNNLGALYDRTGRKSEAEQELRMALADPAYPTPEKVHYNLGLLYASTGRDEDAIHSMRKAVEIDPRYYQAHFELAALLERSGKLEEAAREYEVAAPGYRSSGDYHYRLGFTYFRLGERANAVAHLQRVLEVAPGSEDAARADELLKMVP